MPFDSAGNASVTRKLAVSGQTILAEQVNVPFSDIQSMLSQTALRSGIAPMTGNTNMNGFKIRNLGDPVDDGDVISKSYLDERLSTDSLLGRASSAQSALFAKLGTDNKFDNPWARFIPHPSTSMGVVQSVGFDTTRKYIYTHHNEDPGSGEQGVITRYAFGPGNLTALDYMPMSSLISHSGCAVDQASGMVITGGSSGVALFFTYNPGGAPLNYRIVNFTSFGSSGKVSISWDQKYMVTQIRTSGSSGVITYRFFPRKEVMDAVLATASGGTVDVSALEVTGLRISRPNQEYLGLVFQSHACDGYNLFECGNDTTIKDPGAISVIDVDSGEQIYSSNNFDMGMVSANPAQGNTAHWEIESLDFIKTDAQEPIPSLAVCLAGDAGQANRNCVYLIGPAAPYSKYFAGRPNDYSPTLNVGESAFVYTSPSGETPVLQIHGSTAENGKSLVASWASSTGSEAGRDILRSFSGVVGQFGNATDNANVYVDRFYTSYSGAFVQSGNFFVEVDGSPSVGNVPIRFQWQVMGVNRLTVSSRGAKVGGFLNLGSPVSTAISASAITATASYMFVDTSGGAATDNLSTINGGEAGDILILRSVSSARTVVLIDGTGLRLQGNFSLATLTDAITLLCSSAGVWIELSRSTNS